MSAAKSKRTDSVFKGIIAKKLGVRITSVRKAQGYSSAENFANTHNINRTQYSRYERGQDLQLSTLGRLIEALDVTWAYFFSEGFD